MTIPALPPRVCIAIVLDRRGRFDRIVHNGAGDVEFVIVTEGQFLGKLTVSSERPIASVASPDPVFVAEAFKQAEGDGHCT